MKKILLFSGLFLLNLTAVKAQSCAFDSQITTSDSVLCAGDSTLLSFSAISGTPADTVLPTPVINNNGQDGNMFNITATNTIRVRYFEGLIANTPNPTTQYYIYYKVGTHVGFENNAAAWTLLAGPITVTLNAPPMMTVIPVTVNMVIPAGQTYAFYLTNTSAASNNNRYHNGTATGNVAATNSDLTVYEGTGGAYPFGTFFNARPWEGIIHYDYPPATYLWNTGETTPTISVQPSATTSYSCVGTVAGNGVCYVEDTITVLVNSNPVVALGNDTSICQGNTIQFDAGNAGTYMWCGGETSQQITTGSAGSYCVMVSDANGCMGADTINLFINSLPTIVTTSDSICFGSTGTITASGSSATYSWNPGSFSGSSVSDSPANTTTYTVTALDVNGCSNMDSATITVLSLPTVALTSDVICLNNTALITASGSSANYVWTPVNQSNDSVWVSPSATSTYTLTATDVFGCTTTDSAIVLVNSLPTLFTLGDTICNGATGTVYASGSGTFYSWNSGTWLGNLVYDNPVSTSTYTVTSTDTNNCSSIAMATIVVNSLPVVSVSSFGTHCVDDAAFSLTGGSPAGGFYSGTAVSAGSFSPSTAGNGTHTVAYTYIDANGCASSDSGNVIIDACTGISSNSAATGVSVYPNPFHESATVSIDANTVLHNGIFTLYDITGKIVLEMKNVTSTTISINRNTLENGIYFYTFTDNGVVIGSGKIVVE